MKRAMQLMDACLQEAAAQGERLDEVQTILESLVHRKKTEPEPEPKVSLDNDSKIKMTLWYIKQMGGPVYAQRTLENVCKILGEM